MVHTKTSEGEKNAALSFSFELENIFANSHASLRAHRSCFKVSSSDLSSNFGSMTDTTLMRTSVLNHTLRWTLAFPKFNVALCTS